MSFSIKNRGVEEDGGNRQLYYVKNGKAYTEDKVLIYNIYAYKIIHTVEHSDAVSYFSQFGRLLNIRLVADRKSRAVGRTRGSRPGKIGFIQFEDPISATKVLETKKHFIKNSRFFVKPCDSWRQPHHLNEGGNSGSSMPGPSETPILSLNDDCLIAICEALSFRDKLRFSRVCKRFQEAFRTQSKLHYKKFDMALLGTDKTNQCTVWDVYEFFKVAGPHIRHIHGHLSHSEDYRVLEFMCKYARNIENLDVSRFRITLGKLFIFLPRLKSLKSLNLSRLNINDNIIETISNLPNLESLNLCGCQRLTGRNFHKLSKTNIKELNISQCYMVSTRNFTNMMSSLKTLQTLDVRHCDALDVIGFDALIKNGQEVLHLKLNCSSITLPFELLADLPKLKSLEIKYADNARGMPDRLLRALSQKCQDTLQELKITGRKSLQDDDVELVSSLKALTNLELSNNRVITDKGVAQLSKLKNLTVLKLRHCKSIGHEGLIELIKQCPKLSSLCIDFCDQFKNDLIKKLLESLEERRQRRIRNGEDTIRRFILRAKYTDIDCTSMENTKYGEGAKLLMELQCDSCICQPSEKAYPVHDAASDSDSDIDDFMDTDDEFDDDDYDPEEDEDDSDFPDYFDFMQDDLFFDRSFDMHHGNNYNSDNEDGEDDDAHHFVMGLFVFNAFIN